MVKVQLNYILNRPWLCFEPSVDNTMCRLVPSDYYERMVHYGQYRYCTRVAAAPLHVAVILYSGDTESMFAMLL